MTVLVKDATGAVVGVDDVAVGETWEWETGTKRIREGVIEGFVDQGTRRKPRWMAVMRFTVRGVSETTSVDTAWLFKTVGGES